MDLPFPLETIEKAFDLVKDKENWKMPIDAVIDLDPDTVLVLEYAIPFYCGGPLANFQPLIDGKVRVTHPGYYVCVGA